MDNLRLRLDQFLKNNPDEATQTKRLLASNDEELITYVMSLGLGLRSIMSNKRNSKR
jgi:hypothetical protein